MNAVSESKNAEEPAVQEPDWIPDGDGRAIGQQNFGINLSPLHAETFEAFVMPSKEEYMKTLTKRDKEGHPTTLVIAIDTSGSTMMDYKDRKGRKQYPLLEKYKTMAKQMEKTMGATETIILDWNGQGIKRVTDVDSLRSYNGLFSMEGLKKWLDDELGTIDYYTTVLITDMPLHRFKGAETTGSPSPTFNENITGQDGPSENPTNSNFSAEDSCRKCGRDMGESTVHHDVARCPYNDPTCYTCENCSNHDMCDDPDNPPCFFCGQVSCENISKTDRDECENPDLDEGEHFWAETFEAMRTMAPSTRDVDSARRSLKNSGYGDVIYDRYIVNQQGSSNKFYYTAITENDGKYYPMGAYGRIGYLGRLFNVAGKTERPKMFFGSMELAYRQIKEKEDSKINARKSEKRYVDYTLTRGAESLSEIEGPTAEATSGGLHSPSSFDMTWEDGSGQSSASIPPNEIAWADTKGIPTWAKWGAGIALVLAGGKVLSARMSEQKAENNLKSVVNARKGCCGGSKIVRKDSEFSVGQINPVEVEGQNDVYGAEELHSPQTSAKVSQPNWGPQQTYQQNSRPNLKMW